MMMTPNPLAILDSFVKGFIDMTDYRIDILIEAGWIDRDGKLTDQGKWHVEHGWHGEGPYSEV